MVEPDYGQMPDEELARKVLAGDQQAIALFYMQHFGKLWAFVGKMMWHHHDKEDILQDTYIRFDRRLRNKPPMPLAGTMVVAELYTIARNLVIDRVRRRNVGQEYLDHCIATFDEQTSPCDPSEQCAEQEDAKRVVQALQGLPARQREACVLSIYEGLNDKEIGKRMGATPGATRQLVRRAKHNLRKLLHGGDTGDGTQRD